MTLRDLVTGGPQESSSLPAFILGMLLYWRFWAASGILVGGLFLAGWIVESYGAEAWMLVFFLGALAYAAADEVGEA